jgi:hypothetical protein
MPDFIRLALRFNDRDLPVFVPLPDVALFMHVLTGDEQAPTSWPATELSLAGEDGPRIICSVERPGKLPVTVAVPIGAAVPLAPSGAPAALRKKRRGRPPSTG